MAKAPKSTLTDLHARLAAILVEAVEGGVDENDKEVPASAAILNVARLFLKDNAITADLARNPDLTRLNDRLNALPSFDDGEDDGNYPIN